MSKVKNFFFGIGQKINQTYITWTRQPFDVTQAWFDRMYQKHFTPDIQEKYIESLYEDQGFEERLVNSLNELIPNKSEHLNELRILKDWIDSYLNEYASLKKILTKEKIEVNTISRQHIQLEILSDRCNDYLNVIEQHKNALESNNLSRAKNFVHFNNESLKLARDFEIHEIENYTIEDQFISSLPKEDKDVFTIVLVFRRLKEIIQQLKTCDHYIDNLQVNSLFIHGRAGMGKSNLTARLTTKLTSKKQPVIFIKGQSFRGDPDEFEKVFLRELEVPADYTLSEVLNKIDSFGKKANQRVVLIFDALNETTYETKGFSPLWKNHLDQFINELKQYSYIYIIGTLRTSYIKRIWTENIPSIYDSKELQGFKIKNLRVVVEKYFKHYNIPYDSLSRSDIFYFKTPLILDLFCQMRKSAKSSTNYLGLRGFSLIFQQYIEGLIKQTVHELQLISDDQVTDGIDRCSSELLSELEAFIPTTDFYNLMEGEKVNRVSGSIGEYILNGNLIYIDESISNKSVVIHAQQLLGGYLLAKYLLKEYNNITGVIQSVFFKDHLIGDELKKHQLRDDILLFLTMDSTNNETLISSFPKNKILRRVLLSKLEVEAKAEENHELRIRLIETFDDNEDYSELLNAALTNLIESNSPLRISTVISDAIINLSQYDSDLTWTKFLYNQFYEFDSFINEFELEIGQHEKLQLEDEELILKLELTIWLLETTNRKMRDRATKVLLEYGTTEAEYIFKKAIAHAEINRPYIYERLISICYGIVLRNKNDEAFVNGLFKTYISKFYALQFGDKPKAPTYHYVVIDCIKHMTDLALLKGVFTIGSDDLNKLKAYQFNQPFEWPKSTKEQENEFDGFDFHSRKPDPIGDDFTIYTIPRLLTDKTKHSDSVLSIYARIIELGYIKNENHKELRPSEKEFFFGNYGSIPKIDRLGKKYSWVAFFEYAGYLLLQGKLNFWVEEDTGREPHYERLSDVRLELSYPEPIIYKDRLFDIDLLKHREGNPEWAKIEQFNNTKEVWQNTFEDNHYTLLYGDLSQKTDETYKTRSYVIIESVFVKKEDIEGKTDLVTDRNIDWNDGFYIGGNVSHAYFGELYWSDNIPIMKNQPEGISLEETYEEDYEIQVYDTFRDGEYAGRSVGDIVKRISNKQLNLNVEATLIYYSWETDSDIFPSYGDHVPSPNMGRQLELKADPINLQIIDSEGNLAFKTCKYESDDQRIEHKLNYMRTDLLKQYMEEHGLILAYQIKQHSYDRVADPKGITNDFRGMQYFFPEI